MAVTTTYDSSIARVRVDVDLLGSDCDWALVERSTDGVRWTTVRGASEWPVTSESFNSTLDDYEFPSGEAATYRVKGYDETNFPQDTHLSGLVLDGTSGDYASTPDAASLDIVGDLELMAEVTARDWTPSAAQKLVAKWAATGNQRSYALWLSTDGKLNFSFTTAGVTTITKTSTVAPTIPATGRLAVRATIDVNNGAAGYDVKFYTASSITGSWVQLGSTVTTATATSIHSGTAVLEVGSSDSGTVERFAGVIHAAQVLSGLAGTVVANPDFEVQDNNDTSFVDTAAVPKTWTVNGAAEIVVTQSDDITAELDGVWLKSIIRPYLNRLVRVVGFSEITRPANNGLFDVVGRSYPVAVTDVRGSRRYALTIRTETREDAEDFDLILASGDPIFLHSAAVDHLWLPSQLYAVIGDTTQTRLGTLEATTSDFTLPLTEVAAPSADIAGVAISWQSVLNDYATWQDVNDAFADWQAVLDSTGSLADVIVP